MGRPPAFIFVVRHGNRLDAADKRWHLTSPTPYDPPLTYGGWLQSKALGVRIGNILRQAEADRDVETTEGLDAPRDAEAQPKPRRKQYKVVLHSSPFLRCIQTSIAISAGLAQAPPTSPGHFPSHDESSNSSSPIVGTTSSPVMEATAVSDLALPPNTQGEGRETEDVASKTILRLDAFLGEWLSPDYFEMITPPPSSTLMLKDAKAELLRREDYTSYSTLRMHSSSTSSQLWSGASQSVPTEAPESIDSRVDVPGLDSLTAIASSLPDRDAASNAFPANQTAPKVRFSSVPTPGTPGYTAPTPHYAISLSGKIPEGYVSHAKDACVTVDYQWDSMREPLDWGNGGTFGEEWTSMHRRFRKGIQCLVDWYSTNESPADIVPKATRRETKSDSACAVEDVEVSDVETVIIVVSHGAGCNALIGAITHQPALLDVGIASLTMAVRKPERDNEELPPDTSATELDDNASITSPRGAIPIHQYYDLKIFANTEHLRSTGASATAVQNPSASNVYAATARGRMPNLNSPTGMSPFIYTDSFNRGENRSNSANASLGSIRRSSQNPWPLPRAATMSSSPSSNSGSTGFSGLSRSPSVGLWSPVASRLSQSNEQEDEDLDDMFPDFDHQKKLAPIRKNTKDSIGSQPEAIPETIPEAFPITTSPIPISSNGESDSVDETHTPQLGLGAGGLWGNPRPPGPAERLRDLSSSKRRWTVNERS